MPEISFTQYLMPNGRRKAVTLETTSADVAALATKLLAAGYHFDAEILMDYQTVSLTCEPNRPGPDGEDAPVAHEIVGNGPAVLDAVDRLVRAAASAVFGKSAVAS